MPTTPSSIHPASADAEKRPVSHWSSWRFGSAPTRRSTDRPHRLRSAERPRPASGTPGRTVEKHQAGGQDGEQQVNSAARTALLAWLRTNVLATPAGNAPPPLRTRPAAARCVCPRRPPRKSGCSAPSRRGSQHLRGGPTLRQGENHRPSAVDGGCSPGPPNLPKLPSSVPFRKNLVGVVHIPPGGQRQLLPRLRRHPHPDAITTRSPVAGMALAVQPGT